MKLLMTFLSAALFAATAIADGWPANSCIVSGSTNRTCQAQATVTMATGLSSYWLGCGSSVLADYFRANEPNGLMLLFR